MSHHINTGAYRASSVVLETNIPTQAPDDAPDSASEGAQDSAQDSAQDNTQENSILVIQHHSYVSSLRAEEESLDPVPRAYRSRHSIGAQAFVEPMHSMPRMATLHFLSLANSLHSCVDSLDKILIAYAVYIEETQGAILDDYSFTALRECYEAVSDLRDLDILQHQQRQKMKRVVDHLHLRNIGVYKYMQEFHITAADGRRFIPRCYSDLSAIRLSRNPQGRVNYLVRQTLQYINEATRDAVQRKEIVRATVMYWQYRKALDDLGVDKDDITQYHKYMCMIGEQALTGFLANLRARYESDSKHLFTIRQRIAMCRLSRTMSPAQVAAHPVYNQLIAMQSMTQFLQQVDQAVEELSVRTDAGS